MRVVAGPNPVAVSCCHSCGPLYSIDSSPQYTVFGN